MDNEHAETSNKAVYQAEKFLLEENFCEADGFFSLAKCDWFEIGGRWSGILQEAKEQDKDGNDAAIVDEQLYKHLLEKYHKVEVFDVDKFEELHLQDIKADQIIGRWIVVVDYHR